MDRLAPLSDDHECSLLRIEGAAAQLVPGLWGLRRRVPGGAFRARWRAHAAAPRRTRHRPAAQRRAGWSRAITPGKRPAGCRSARRRHSRPWPRSGWRRWL